MAERADLVGRLAATALDLGVLVDVDSQLVVEGAQQRHPRALAAGDLVELLLHPRGELDVDVVAEMLDEEVGHDLGDGLRVEPALLDADVAAVGDRRDRRRVRRRPADAVLLERLDQRRLGEARRRLGEVLGRRDVADVGDARPRSAPAAGRRLLVVVGGRVVAALGVDDARSRRTAPSSPTRAARSGRRPARSSSSRAPWAPSATRARAARSAGRGAASSDLREAAIESGSRLKLVGRIDSWASWAPFDFVL